jgi:hypothetical protein
MATDLPCGCHNDDLPDLIRQSGQPWIHIDGHGDAYAATEDRATLAQCCHPCFGAVGPYTATHVYPAVGLFRCAGCLRYDLIHHTSISAVIDHAAWRARMFDGWCDGD